MLVIVILCIFYTTSCEWLDDGLVFALKQRDKKVIFLERGYATQISTRKLVKNSIGGIGAITTI